MDVVVILTNPANPDQDALVVGPFPDKPTAEVFGQNVSPMDGGDLEYTVTAIFTPEDYMEG